MGFLDSIFPKRSLQSLELKKAFNLERVGMDGIPAYPEYDRQSLMGWFERNEVVYACIKKKGEAAVDPELVVEKQNGKGEWESIEGHPLVSLLQKPNPDDTYETFMMAWVASEECTGEFFAEIVRDKKGIPIELYPLDPWKMFPVYKGGKRAYWEFHSGHGTPIRLNLDEVLYRKKGVSPLKVAMGSVDADQAQTDFTRAFFHSDGIPAGILRVLNKNLSQEEASSLQQGWMTRFRRGGTQYKQVAVLDQNAEYQQIGSNIGEIESATVRGQVESRICMVFGVPPALIGAYVGMDLATNDATLKSLLSDFWDNTMSPDLKARRSFLTWKLLPEFEPIEQIKAGKIAVAYDMTYVMALQEDENERHRRARENFQAGGWSINEFREQTGMEPVEGEDYYLQPKSLDPVAELVRQILAIREPPEPPTPEQIEGDTVDGEIVPPKQIGDGAKEAVFGGKLSDIPIGKDAEWVVANGRAHLKKKSFDYNGLTLSREPRPVEVSIDLKAINDSFDKGKERITRVINGIRDDLVEQAVDIASTLSADDIYTLTLQPPPTAYKRLKKEIENAYEAGREQVRKELGLSSAKDKQEPGFLSRLIDLLVSRIIGEISIRAINIFTSLGTLGLNDEEITARLKDELDEQSMKVFESYAAQAANAAINAGRDAEALENKGEWERVEYSAILDNATCDTCEAADGMTADDPADLPEAPNPDCSGGARCRCFHIYIHAEGNA